MGVVRGLSMWVMGGYGERLMSLLAGLLQQL